MNENTFKERLKLFFIKNQRSSECSLPVWWWGRETIAICWQPAPSSPGAEPGFGAQPGAAATPCPVPNWSWAPPRPLKTPHPPFGPADELPLD